MLTLLTLVYAFNWVDRNVLGLLTQAIKTGLRLSDTQMRIISGIAFALFYATRVFRSLVGPIAAIESALSR